MQTSENDHTKVIVNEERCPPVRQGLVRDRVVAELKADGARDTHFAAAQPRAATPGAAFAQSGR